MPTPFLDISFPDAVARGATGGPGFLTDVVSLGSGKEQRNIRWAQARAKYNIATGVRTRAQMADVIALFRVVAGRAYSFRFKDWTDYDAADMQMVQVSSTVWQLVKRYSIGGQEYIRTITKPKSGTVSVTATIGGEAAAPTIDYSTGLCTFAAAPDAPPTATFEFDVCVRFDIDQLPVTANAWDQQVVSQIDLVEVTGE